MNILFTDLDETLLNEQKQIPPQKLSAIQRAAEKGHLTVITTGRSLSSALPYVRSLAKLQSACYVIAYNGGMLHVPLSCAYAAGDAENDLSMLKEAGTGISMANGSPQIQACADYITEKDNNQGGIAEIIEKFIEN